MQNNPQKLNLKINEIEFYTNGFSLKKEWTECPIAAMLKGTVTTMEATAANVKHPPTKVRLDFQFAAAC